MVLLVGRTAVLISISLRKRCEFNVFHAIENYTLKKTTLVINLCDVNAFKDKKNSDSIKQYTLSTVIDQLQRNPLA